MFVRFITMPGGSAIAMLALLCVSAPTKMAANPQPAEVRTTNHNDPDLHLFVDDEEIERVDGMARIVNRPHKRSTPILVGDMPWEGERAQAWGSVIVEPNGLLRIWYFAFNTERRKDELDRGGYAYAESLDGITWKKTELGVVEFRGSTKNNLFYTCAPNGKNLVDEELARRGLGLPALDAGGMQLGVLNNLDGLTVVRDDEETDPQKRYKLIANMQDHRMWAPYDKNKYSEVTNDQVKQAQAVWGQYIDTSPDGIHWTRRPRRVLPAVGDYMMVTRDYRNSRWWLNERAAGQLGRNAAIRTSKDLLHWSEPELIFGHGSDPGYGKEFEWHGGITPFNYGNLNLGFLERWPLTGFGATCELVSQRDGKKWYRVAPGMPFLDIGPEGAFDRTLIFPTHNAPIRIGDQLYIFYTGGGAKTDAREGMPMSIGLATIRLDRFAALATWRSKKPGLVITKPFKLERSQLEVNVESFDRGPIRIGVTDADGNTIPGYSLDDCRTSYDSAKIYTRIRWADKLDLRELHGHRVKLQFEITGAALYSYHFTEGQ
jgi:hypothetical protein